MKIKFIGLITSLLLGIIQCIPKTNALVIKDNEKVNCNISVKATDIYMENSTRNEFKGISYNGFIYGILRALNNGTNEPLEEGVKYKIFDNGLGNGDARYKNLYINLKTENCKDTLEVLRLFKKEMEDKYKVSWRHVIQEIEQWKWKVVDTNKLYEATYKNKAWGSPGRVRHITFMNDTINSWISHQDLDSFIFVEEMHLEWLANFVEFEYKLKEAKGTVGFEPLKKLAIDISKDAIFQDTTYVYDVAFPKHLVSDFDQAKLYLYEKMGIESTKLPTKYLDCIEIFRLNN